MKIAIINKARKNEENTKCYLYVENDHLRNYISHIISDYDKIHISVTKIFILINCLKYLLLI